MDQQWQDVLAGVQTIADLIQTCQDAFSEDEAAPKVRCLSFTPQPGIPDQRIPQLQLTACLLLCAGICHDQETPDSKSFARLAGRVGARPGRKQHSRLEAGMSPRPWALAVAAWWRRCLFSCHAVSPGGCNDTACALPQGRVLCVWLLCGACRP